MARFEPKAFKFIFQRLINRVVARSELTDIVEGSNLHVLLGATARELDDINFQMLNLQRVWDIDTAQGEDLNARGEDLNPDEMVRLGATKATGSVVFSRTGTSGAVTIPSGTVVRVPDDGPEFETTAVGTIPDLSSSSGSVTIQAIVAGDAGNVNSSAITGMDAVSGVETVTNGAATTGGQDRESDSQYRTRMVAYLRSLPRGTVDALKYAVLSTSLDLFGRIVTAEIEELSGASLGIVNVYVDDGAGTVTVTTVLAATDTLIASATGGEQRAFLANVPVVQGATVTVRRNAGLLIENTDYTLNYATGQVELDAVVFPTGLTAGDILDATAYTYYGGLIAEAQKIIDGDPADRANYPGYRAAGTQVFVLAPTTLQQTVIGTITVESGYTAATVIADATSAVNRYVNGLGINGDVIHSEIVHAVQSIPGVYDVDITTPSGNTTIARDELARIVDANIDLT